MSLSVFAETPLFVSNVSFNMFSDWTRINCAVFSETLVQSFISGYHVISDVKFFSFINKDNTFTAPPTTQSKASPVPCLKAFGICYIPRLQILVGFYRSRQQWCSCWSRKARKALSLSIFWRLAPLPPQSKRYGLLYHW